MSDNISEKQTTFTMLTTISATIIYKNEKVSFFQSHSLLDLSSLIIPRSLTRSMFRQVRQQEPLKQSLVVPNNITPRLTAAAQVHNIWNQEHTICSIACGEHVRE